MHRIRPWLFIGKYRHTRELQLLQAHNIQAMLQLAELVEQPGVTTLFLPVKDFAPLSPQLLQQGVDFVKEQMQKNHTTLVACGAGINRSTAFCVAVLKEVEGLSLLEAFGEVKRRHRQAMPHPPVWQSLCQYYAEDVPMDRLYSWSEASGI